MDAEATRQPKILALASQIASDASLLGEWLTHTSAGTRARLVVYPDTERITGSASDAGVAILSRQAGDALHIRATVLSAPLSDDDHKRLLSECAGFLGNGEIPSPLRGLPRLGLDDLSAICEPGQPDLGVMLVGDGDRMYHRGTEADIGTLHQIFQFEEYSFAPLEPWLGPSDGRPAPARQRLIVDCGANIGASVLYFARAFPDAKIVALEPEPANFALLCRNAQPLADVSLRNQAIGSRRGTLQLVDPGLGEWGYRVGDGGEGRTLGMADVVTIDDILGEFSGAEPFVLKVDIEGGEADLFTQRGESLNRFPVVVVELHDWMLRGRDVSGAFLDWHRAFRREIRTAGENVFSLAASLRP